MNESSFIVIGALNTDIIASGLTGFPEPNQWVRADKMTIGPGGKSRNIADMASRFLPEGTVAMVGRTAQDAYGLWRLPIDALRTAGVNTDYVKVLGREESDQFPSVALIGVDTAGNNNIFLIPGASDAFNTEDIDSAEFLFAAAGRHKGLFVATLECPLKTAQYGVQKANEHGLRVLLDPGGVSPGMDISSLLRSGIYLLKPNEHEAELITGVVVDDFASARQAAGKLRHEGVQNVLITHGEHGAYLFGEELELHVPVNQSIGGTAKDATGCGDQAMAVLCARLQHGKSLEESTRAAVTAGTLQFYKAGIQPITEAELAAAA